MVSIHLNLLQENPRGKSGDGHGLIPVTTSSPMGIVMGKKFQAIANNAIAKKYL